MPFNQTGRISRAIVAVAGKSFRLADYFSGLLDEQDLPLPTYVVSSGNGFHGHYAFEEPDIFPNKSERTISQAQRKAFEQVYIAAFKTRGWKLDAIADLPRITRMPGTLNHKTNPPKLVTLVEGYESPGRLSREKYLEVIARSQPNAISHPGSAIAIVPSSPTTSEYPAKLGDAAAVFAGCRWAARLKAQAERIPEPHWFALAGVLKHMKDGNGVFHEVSQADPRYDYGQAESLFNRAKGPTKCEHIQKGLGASECDSCPLAYTAMSSPVGLSDISPYLAMLMAHNVYATKRQMFFNTDDRQPYSQKFINERFGKFVGNSASHAMIMDHRLLQTNDAWYDPGVLSFLTKREGRPAFNSWLPSGLLPMSGDTSIVLEHFDYLIPIKAERDHFISALAHAVQRPREKIKHMLFVIGGQGTGKSWLGLLISRLFGSHNICVVDNSLLTSDFNAQMADKQVLIMEEVGLEDREGAYQTLKRWITEDCVKVNEKHVPMYDAATPKLIIAMSNKDLPLKIEGDDRRLFFVSSPKIPKDQGYYSRIFNEGLDQAASFLHYLLSRDITGFSATGRPPMTSVKQRVIASSATVAVQEVRSMMEENAWPLSEELFQFDDLSREIKLKASNRGDRSSGAIIAALRTNGFERASENQIRIAGNDRVRLWAKVGSIWIDAPAEQLKDQWLKQGRVGR